MCSGEDHFFSCCFVIGGCRVGERCIDFKEQELMDTNYALKVEGFGGVSCNSPSWHL